MKLYMQTKQKDIHQDTAGEHLSAVSGYPKGKTDSSHHYTATRPQSSL